MSARGYAMYDTTIAKIETGLRTVNAAELGAFADLLGVAADVLIARSSSGDLAWSVSKLTSGAQKMAGEVTAISERLRNDYDDVRMVVGDPTSESLIHLFECVGSATLRLTDASGALNRVANQFPLPTDHGPAS